MYLVLPLTMVSSLLPSCALLGRVAMKIPGQSSVSFFLREIYYENLLVKVPSPCLSFFSAVYPTCLLLIVTVPVILISI
jgi:hypothetical protein